MIDGIDAPPVEISACDATPTLGEDLREQGFRARIRPFAGMRGFVERHAVVGARHAGRLAQPAGAWQSSELASFIPYDGRPGPPDETRNGMPAELRSAAFTRASSTPPLSPCRVSTARVRR